MPLSTGEMLMRAANATGPNAEHFKRWALEALDKDVAAQTPRPGQPGYAAHLLSGVAEQLSKPLSK